MKFSNVDPNLVYNMATLRFQEIGASNIPWDSCIRTRSMEAPMLWVLVSIKIFEPVCTGWFERGL
eukprot:1888131-Pyramimonas_sp.AAC.1